MSSREERIEVFEDTQAWINENKDLSDSISFGKKHTEIFYENDYPDFDINLKYDTQVTVTKDRSYQAAMRLHSEDKNSKIAVMNFANAFHAGGGVTSGASAQEDFRNNQISL